MRDFGDVAPALDLAAGVWAECRRPVKSVKDFTPLVRCLREAAESACSSVSVNDDVGYALFYLYLIVSGKEIVNVRHAPGVSVVEFVQPSLEGRSGIGAVFQIFDEQSRGVLQRLVEEQSEKVEVLVLAFDLLAGNAIAPDGELLRVRFVGRAEVVSLVGFVAAFEWLHHEYFDTLRSVPGAKGAVEELLRDWFGLQSAVWELWSSRWMSFKAQLSAG